MCYKGGVSAILGNSRETLYAQPGKWNIASLRRLLWKPKVRKVTFDIEATWVFRFRRSCEWVLGMCKHTSFHNRLNCVWKGGSLSHPARHGKVRFSSSSISQWSTSSTEEDQVWRGLLECMFANHLCRNYTSLPDCCGAQPFIEAHLKVKDKRSAYRAKTSPWAESVVMLFPYCSPGVHMFLISQIEVPAYIFLCEKFAAVLGCSSYRLEWGTEPFCIHI